MVFNDSFKALKIVIFGLLLSGGSLRGQSVERIVSLSPIASKAIVLLGAEEQVVGCTKWCPFADEKKVLANAIDVNVEQVLRARPDVVFASTLTSRESLATLRRLGIEVVALPRMVSFESMGENLLLIASKMGKESRARSELNKARRRLSEVRKKIPTDGKAPKVMFQVGTKPVFVGIRNTFIDDYITQSGGENIYGDLEHGTVTRTSVIRRNPDAIFISTMPTSAEDARKSWLAFPELSATQQGKIASIDEELASSPTIHTFIDVVEIMIGVLYN